MTKRIIAILLLLIPLLCYSQLKHDAAYWDYTWYGNHTFTGWISADSMNIRTIVVDTITIEYMDAEYIDADSIMVNNYILPDDSAGANLGKVSLPFHLIYADSIIANSKILPGFLTGAAPVTEIGSTSRFWDVTYSVNYYGGMSGDDPIGFEFDGDNINFVNVDTLFDLTAVESNIFLTNIKIVPVSTDSVDIGNAANIFRGIYSDSSFANWFGGIGADFEIGEAGYDVTIDADTVKGAFILTGADKIVIITSKGTPLIIGTDTDNQRFKVDSTGNIDADGYVSVLGETFFGDAATDTVLIRGIVIIQEDIAPNADGGSDIGTAGTEIDSAFIKKLITDYIGSTGTEITMGTSLNIDKLTFTELTVDGTYDLMNLPLDLAAGDSGSVIFQLDGQDIFEMTARGDGADGIDSIWVRINDPDGTAFITMFSDGTNKTFTVAGNIYGLTYGSDASISDAELKTIDDGATTQILVGGGAGSAPVWGADIPTGVTIGSAYIYRVGGTDVAFADGGLGFSTGLQGDIVYLTDYNTVGRFAWTGVGNYIVSAADSNWTTAALLTDAVAGDGLGGGSDNVLLGSDVDVTFAVLLDFNGGLETVDDSINIKLDGATLTLSSTGLKVTDNTYQPLEATLIDIADGTIAENLVNTANPWADNEIASSATWNARLDTAIILIWSDTTGVIATVSDTTILSDRISGKADSGAVLHLAQDETITGEVTFDSDTLKFTNLSTVFYFDSIQTFYSKVTTPANGFVEFVRSDGSGAASIGRTNATAPSTVAITDGGADNEPGTLQLYTDGGSAIYLHARTDGRVRYENGSPADDDAATNLILTYEDTTTLATKDNITGGSLAGSFTALTLGANYRGSDTFTTTAVADTILNADFNSTDYFLLTATGATITSNDVLSAEAKTDTLIVHRPASGTSGLTFNWLRVK